MNKIKKTFTFLIFVCLVLNSNTIVFGCGLPFNLEIPECAIPTKTNSCTETESTTTVSTTSSNNSSSSTRKAKIAVPIAVTGGVLGGIGTIYLLKSQYSMFIKLLALKPKASIVAFNDARLRNNELFIVQKGLKNNAAHLHYINLPLDKNNFKVEFLSKDNNVHYKIFKVTAHKNTSKFVEILTTSNNKYDLPSNSKKIIFAVYKPFQTNKNIKQITDYSVNISFD